MLRSSEHLRGVFRLLVIEDDEERVVLFRSWVPKDVRIVWAKSAGAAMGLIRLDSGHVYGGILLDHDLQQKAMTEDDLTLSGTQVAILVAEYISTEVPILVHSTNQREAPKVARQLEHSGFWVTHIPMYHLTEELFSRWLLEARQFWNEMST